MGTIENINVQMNTSKEVRCFHNWHESALQVIGDEYHIIQDGILNKKDYSLVFETENGKREIPVGVVEQINIYSDAAVTPGALRLIAKNNIRMGVFDKYGNRIACFVPEHFGHGSFDFLKQAMFYQSGYRLEIARRMEIAGLHNIRAVLKYYNRYRQNVLRVPIDRMTKLMGDIEQAGSVQRLMILEAEARQMYYQAMNVILYGTGFRFERRSKRPPLDALNAMISFGNTLLYNAVLKAIWKTTLDPRIGIVHATTERDYSLNLDFADLFKPLIVDRVIFSMINLGQIKADKDFCTEPSGAVFLNKDGRRKFIECFEEKLAARLQVQGQTYTYRQLLMREVRAFQKYIRGEEDYKPYKYW